MIWWHSNDMLTKALCREGMDLSEGHWFHTDYYWKKEITGSRMWDVVMEEAVPIYCLCAVKYWPKFWPPRCYKQRKSWKRRASRCSESPLRPESTAVPKKICFPSLALFRHFTMLSHQEWRSFLIYLIVVRWNWFVWAVSCYDNESMFGYIPEMDVSCQCLPSHNEEIASDVITHSWI